MTPHIDLQSCTELGIAVSTNSYVSTATPIRLDQFSSEIRHELKAYGPMLKQANI